MWIVGVGRDSMTYRERTIGRGPVNLQEDGVERDAREVLETGVFADVNSGLETEHVEEESAGRRVCCVSWGEMLGIGRDVWPEWGTRGTSG